MLDSGRVRCWGDGGAGKLGLVSTETIGDDETPASADELDIGAPVTEISAGYVHTCALLDSGAVRSWGSAGLGALGYGNGDNIGDNETPAAAGDVEIGATVADIATRFAHTCALSTDGSVRCWGSGDSGRLGYGNTETIGDDETPAEAGAVDVGNAASIARLVTGGDFTCVLLVDGKVRCWGAGRSLGYGNLETIGDDELPSTVGEVDVGGLVTQLAAGTAHTCARLENGAVRCWGDGFHGALGYGSEEDVGDDETPAQAGDVLIGGAVKQLVAGDYFTCALLETGAVRCWGLNHFGQLGYGHVETIGDDETPASAGDVAVGGPVAQLAAGRTHACALLVSGKVRCWGAGASGRLGYGNTKNIGDDETPASAGDVEVVPAFE